MTLAVFFLSFMFLTSAPLSGAQGAHASEQQPSPPAQEPQTAPAAQTPETKPSGQEPETENSPSKKSGAKRHTHKKSRAESPCTEDPLTSSHPQSTTANAEQNTTQPSGKTPPAKNCPPPKIIVRQGGTKEPSIQLAGGPSTDQAVQKRDAINQLLDTTDQNLKKTAAMQLTSAQQDTVTQTREFMQQSKTAMANGDFERAHTLAWKAQLLSQDLVNPEK